MAIREKVLIIGNGFDLYHGLPTKYSQFIGVLINIEALNIENELEITFEDLFKNIEGKSEMKIRFDTEKFIFDKEKVIEIKHSLQNNSWYNSFKEKLSFENWIDVENEIKFTLTLINSLLNNINALLKENKKVTQLTINDNNRGVKTKIELNQKELRYCNVFYLTNPNDDWVFDSKNFECKDDNLIKFMTGDYYENLFVELQTFTKIFNSYLESFVSLFYQKIDSKYSSSLEVLKGNVNSFYTFNYTPTLEKLYNLNTEKINYIHGKHNLENNNIVLGIDEVEEEFISDKIFMFTKYYQKLFNNTDYEFLTDIYEKSLGGKYQGQDRDFIIFGHSLADNDQNYIVDLFELGKLRNNTITVLYYNQNDKAQKLKNLLKIVGRKDIEYLMKKKRLVFMKINDKPFETVFKSLPKS